MIRHPNRVLRAEPGDGSHIATVDCSIRHADNDLVDSLGLAGVTGNNYSLVEMKSGAIANNLALNEYDVALVNADHGPQLVVEELVPAVFGVFRESDPVAD